MLNRMYFWTLEKAGHPHSRFWLSGISFAESSFFPIPPDILLIPMVLARRDKWLQLSILCTLSSVIGGLVGYAIGYFLYEAVGRAIVDIYHLQDQFDAFQHLFQDYGAWIVIIKGMTPIPYKLITIAAGVAKLDLLTFVFASVISRFMRFFLVALLLRLFGAPIQAFIEKRLKLVTSAIAVLLVGGFLVLKLI